MDEDNALMTVLEVVFIARKAIKSPRQSLQLCAIVKIHLTVKAEWLNVHILCAVYGDLHITHIPGTLLYYINTLKFI